MITDIVELMTALRTYLAADATLSSVDAFAIRKYNKGTLPDFSRAAVVISPDKTEEKLVGNRTMQKTIGLNVVAVVKIGHPETALIGKTAPDIGVIPLVDLLRDALKCFVAAHPDELTVLYDEVSEEIRYDEVRFEDKGGYYPDGIAPFRERADYYYEVVIPFKARLAMHTF